MPRAGASTSSSREGRHVWLLCLVRAFYGLRSLSGQLGAAEWRGGRTGDARSQPLSHRCSHFVDKDAHKGCVPYQGHRSDAGHSRDSDPGSLALEQDFLTAAVFDSGLDDSCCEGCPVHCGISDLYPLGSSITPSNCDNYRCLQTLPLSPDENHCLTTCPDEPERLHDPELLLPRACLFLWPRGCRPRKR